MAHVFDDGALETTTGTGTGPWTLVAATGYKRVSQMVDVFRAAAIAVNDTVHLTIIGVDANGARTGEWASVLATYSAANQITVTSTYRSSNSNAPVTFTAGTKIVTAGLVAGRTPMMDNLGAILLPAATAEPPTPPAGHLYLYPREIVPGHVVPKVKRPSGVDTPLQDDISFNGLARWTGSNNTFASLGAAVLTSVGTLGAITPATGTAANALQRVQIASAATAAAFASVYANNAGISPMMRGGQAGEGGFRWVNRFRLNLLQSGNRGAWGVSDVVSAPGNVDPTTSTTPGKIALVINANTGNWQLAHNVSGTAPTLIALGANFPIDITSLMELVLFVRPFSGTAGNIGYRVRRYTTASDSPAFEASGTLSTNIPAATTLLHPAMWMTNNATAAAVQWHFGSASVQRDW